MTTTTRDVTVPSNENDAFVTDWEAWHDQRISALNAPDGPPTLVATYWLEETNVVPGVDGTWSEEDGEVLLSLAPGAEALVDGRRTSGQVVALAPGELLGRRLEFASVTTRVATREGRRGVRVFDHSRAGRLLTLDTYPPDPSFVLEGSYEPLPERYGVNYSYALESAPRETEVPGVVRFTLGGRDYAVNPLLSEESLLLVFADRTTGTSTKPPSRFLLIAPPVEGLDHPGTVRLDFNRAYLPPCAFSDEFNCPLPPSHHRFDVVVAAGETWSELIDVPPPGATTPVEFP